MRHSDVLYFIRAGDFVKIGRTSDLDGRMKTLQVGCPHEIEEATGFSGCGSEERVVHTRLAAHKVRGEWFRWHDGIQAEMRRLSAKARQKQSESRNA